MKYTRMKFDDHLLACIRQEKNEEAETILQGLNPYELIDNLGNTLLHIAAECGNKVITKYLIGRGCAVDAVNCKGNTPLILASHQHPRVIRVIGSLLRANASVLKANNQGKSAAKIILGDPRRIDGAFELILKKVKAECLNDSLLTAKELLKAKCPISRAVRLKDVVVTKYLLQNGCNVNDRDPECPNITALHQAVIFNDPKTVKLLIHSGADVNAIDSAGKRPLSFASDNSKRKTRIFKMLLKGGVKLIGEDGTILIPEIFRRGKKETVNKLLIKYDLDLMAKDNCIKERPLVHLIADNKNLDLFEIIKDLNFDINVKDNYGNTLLLNLLFTNNIRMVKYLLKNGADVNVTRRGHATVLRVVCFSVRYKEYSVKLGLKYINLLLKYGADPQYIVDVVLHNEDGPTIFDYVNIYRTFELIKPILAHLAVIEEIGGEIKDITYTKINSHNMFRKYLDYCKRTIEKMKQTTICQTGTLFQILTENRVENIFKLARNAKLLAQMRSIMYFKRRSKLYYHTLLRVKVAKMVKMVNLRQKFIDIVSEIKELQMNVIIVGKIVDYVIYDDLKVITAE